MYNITMAATWSTDELQRLIVRRKRYANEETVLLSHVKQFTPAMWKDDDYRWLGKEYKEQIKYCQQNVKCCTMLLDYFDGKIVSCNVSTDLEYVFLLCCAELEY